MERYNGEPNIQPHKKAASTAFAFGDVVTKDSSGYLAKATATTPRSQVVGLIQRTVASTDTDYADNTTVPVEVPRKTDQFVFTVGTGSAVQAMEGQAYDLKDENELDVTKQLVGLVTIDKVISTTKVIGHFNLEGKKPRLVSYQETIALADFTDGGAAAGTASLNVSIPVGAVFAQALIDDITGFAGDTSAVATIGDGTDVDRYNTGTPSVFADAAGVAAGAPSGTAYHSAAKTPVVTVTSATDFGAITGGQITVTLFWYAAD